MAVVNSSLWIPRWDWILISCKVMLYAWQVIIPKEEALGASVSSGCLQHNVLLLHVHQAVQPALLHTVIQRWVMFLVR